MSAYLFLMWDVEDSENQLIIFSWSHGGHRSETLGGILNPVQSYPTHFR